LCHGESRGTRIVSLYIVFYIIYMQRYCISFLLFFLSVFSFRAAALDEGYYRVKNAGSSRYCYVWDNTGSLDYSKTDADLGAIELFKTTPSRFSDPSTVIYVKKVDDSYDIQAQGTGVYSIIQHYVSLSDRGNGTYWIYASAQGLTKYLCDENTSKRDERGWMATATSNTQPAYQAWIPTPISENTDEYFGVTPNVTLGSRQFKPFYASFPFKFASSEMKAWYISGIDNQKGVAIIAQYNGEIVPGATPIIIETTSSEATNNRLALKTSGGTNISGNKLLGCYFCNKYRLTSANAKTEFDPATMRLLGVNTNGKLAYMSSSSSLQEINGKKYLPANESYLKVDASAPAELLVMTQEEYDAAYPPAVNVTSITLSQSSATLRVGGTLQLTATVAPSNATNKSYTWSTSDATIAQIDNTGKISAMAIGTATIKATADDGSNVSASCVVTVEPTPVDGIVISGAVDSLLVGATVQLSATITPSDASYPNFTWSSSNNDIAGVSENGVVSALSAGNVVITVRVAAQQEISDSVTIVVYETENDAIDVVVSTVNNVVFNLQGQRITDIESLDQLPEGIYIVDGKTIRK